MKAWRLRTGVFTSLPEQLRRQKMMKTYDGVNRKKRGEKKAAAICLITALMMSAPSKASADDSWYSWLYGREDAEKVSNGSFTVEIPDYIMRISDVETDEEEKSISFYEKQSRKSYGGFAGEIRMVEDADTFETEPEDETRDGFTKKGVVTDADGEEWDLILIEPGERQYDPVNIAGHENWLAIREFFSYMLNTLSVDDGGSFVPEPEKEAEDAEGSSGDDSESRNLQQDTMEQPADPPDEADDPKEPAAEPELIDVVFIEHGP